MKIFLQRIFLIIFWLMPVILGIKLCIWQKNRIEEKKEFLNALAGKSEYLTNSTILFPGKRITLLGTPETVPSFKIPSSSVNDKHEYYSTYELLVNLNRSNKNSIIIVAGKIDAKKIDNFRFNPIQREISGYVISCTRKKRFLFPSVFPSKEEMLKKTSGSIFSSFCIVVDEPIDGLQSSTIFKSVRPPEVNKQYAIFWLVSTIAWFINGMLFFLSSIKQNSAKT